MLSNSYCFGTMKGLSNKQLQNFVSNESICYEKIVKSCEESDKPEAIKETSKKKEKDQLETFEDSFEHLKYATEVAAPVNHRNSDVNRPPSIVFINVQSNGQHNTNVVK